uniref:Putative short chain dehydrogenase n=1 Tax=uncultured marine microorganism HF4000_APKG10H11 TaxID=455559 RepID=B3TC36_9ZZZZ|nr:putative short chain dehydrogenase [uncultured marine microorganism HF4000_APKG10H11]
MVKIKMKLQNKVSIVTGGSIGIGKAIAELYSDEGATVIIADVNEEQGKKTVDNINQKGGNAIFIKTDVSNEREVDEMIKMVVGKFKKIDILCNNAGIVGTGTICDTDTEEWDRIMNVNMKGVFLCIKYVIPVMMKTGGGSIVNLSSISGLTAFPSLTAYSASKAGVILITKTVAIDYGKHNIRVNAICPSNIETPMFEELLEGLPDPNQARKNLLDMIPMKRFGTPEDVAKIALFLASDESSFVTGEYIMVDGGNIAGYIR